jgi:DNA-nicking Smr family endonuclease
MRGLSADEIGLWRRAVRDVAPLRGRARPQPEPKRGPPVCTEGGAIATQALPPGPRPRQVPHPAPQPQPQPPLDRFAGIDRVTAERLKRGRYPVEARLDLHGMTQAEAHRALSGFVAASRSLGRRSVLVITGHGRISGGILKAAVPRWLAEPELRRHLLAITPAQPRDGGAGALYLLLRRRPA